MGGKKDGSSSSSARLGRALIRQHNQMVLQSKDRSKFLRLQNKRVMESVTEVSGIDVVVQQAEEAYEFYSVNNPHPNLINLDSNKMPAEERRRLQRDEEALHATSLRVPRRPPWSAGMSVEELDANERHAFLIWRRNLAK